MRLPLLGPKVIADIARAIRLNAREPRTAVFVSTLLRPREIKLATALRQDGWKVILLYRQTTPFRPADHFDVAIRLPTDQLLHRIARMVQPRICHVFSGAVDETVLRFCREKPGPVVVDLNDVFCPSLFNYLEDRFEPTREVLSLADGLVCRDLQPKFAERLDGYALPEHILLFPEYSWLDSAALPGAAPKRPAGEVHVVSVGTFTLETEGMYDSAYLKLAGMLTAQGIHLHIYPHWFFRHASGSMFNFDQRQAFRQFYEMQERTPFLHLHESLPVDQLARELNQYDFGLVSGGSNALGQKLGALKPAYMEACYSGRIADYLDARLPVLINPEVRFNARLLRHYGVFVDLNGVLRDGFKDTLLELKSNTALRRATGRAAKILSLGRQASRLGEFYQRVMEYRFTAPSPMLVRLAGRTVPSVARYIAGLRAQAAEVPALRHERNQLVTEVDRRGKQINSLAQSKKDLERELSQAKTMASELRATTAALKLRMGSAGPAGRRSNLSYEHEIQHLTKGESDELVGLLNWSEIADPVEREQGYAELVRIMQLFVAHRHSDVEKTESDFSSAWRLLARKNLDELLRDGFRRFKRTVAMNYFTFPVQAGDPQIADLESLVGEDRASTLWQSAVSLPDDEDFGLADQRYFRYHLLLLNAYARGVDQLGLLDRLDEPLEGRPVAIGADGRRVSQDLVNSVLEYYSIHEGRDPSSARRILEIGGGYGRNAFVSLSADPQTQYVMVDIPPAIYVAQRYLSSVFRNLPIFRVMDFANFEEVRSEFEQSSIAFLLPHQLALLPDRYADLVVNISSFGEMTLAQIDRYFAAIDRVGSGNFYMKQWQQSRNPFDGLVLNEADYPVPSHWRTVYSRPSVSNRAFFEALYEVGASA